MRRADQVAGVGFLVFSAGYAGAALRWYSYWGDTGPGPGFLPVWLGLAMAVLAAILTVRSSRAGTPDGAWLPTGKGLVRLLVVLGATALFIALMNVTGMILGSALFLLGILRFLEGYPWGQTAGIAAGTALVNYLVFTYWLQVPFPTGILGF